MILLCSTSPKCHCAAKKAKFFTIIFAVFLHDLASVYQMSSKRGAKIAKVGHVISTRFI